MSSTNSIYVNTSNPGKLAEYQEYFSPQLVISQTRDLAEPNADPLTIIQYKASQFEEVLVDDVSLDIEGEEVGVNIRWHLNKMHIYFGKRCTYVCNIAIKVNNTVHVYRGSVTGQIVMPRGDCFGFGKYFLPDGTNKTLGEYMDPEFNARSLAVRNFKNKSPFTTLPVLSVWNGAFQSKQ